MALNPFYNPTANPSTNSKAVSALMRAEFADIAAGFALFPSALLGQGGKALVVNAGGSQIVLTVGTLALAGNFTTTGAFNTTLIQQGSYSVTLPPYNSVLATIDGVETLTNKTVATAAPGTSSTGLANTAFVTTGIGVETARALAAEAVLAPLANPTFTGTPIAPTATFGTNTTQIATTAYVETAIGAGSIIAAGLINGLTLSNDGSTPNTVLDIAAGRTSDSTNAIVIVLGAGITKSISSSWVTGSGNGGMGTGLTATASTWYHVFAIVVATVADVYFDTSPVGANRPAGTTAFRRIGSFRVNASTNILPFVQNGDRFDLVTPITAFNGTPGASAITVSLLTPNGVVTEGILSGQYAGSGGTLYLSSLAQANLSPSITQAITAYGTATGWTARIMTDANSSIRARTASAFDTLTVVTNGWIDTRNR